MDKEIRDEFDRIWKEIAKIRKELKDHEDLFWRAHGANRN